MEYVVVAIVALLVLLGSAIGSIASNLIASELYDRAPSIAAWLIEHAVRRLPEHERDRYREEWLAHLDEYPGKLSHVWHSLGCFFGASAVARAAGAKRSTSYTKDAQHQLQQEKRIQENSARVSGATAISLEYERAKIHLSYDPLHRYLLSEKAAEVLTAVSDGMNQDGRILEDVKDVFTDIWSKAQDRDKG